MTDKIPPDIMKLMKAGICPTCKMPMVKANGKKTHSRNKAIVCEEILREKYGIKRSSIKVGDKTYEVDARIMPRDEANELKKQTKGRMNFQN